MATTLINAVRKSYKKNPKVTVSRTQPMANDQLKFANDISMNVAGRKMVES